MRMCIYMHTLQWERKSRITQPDKTRIHISENSKNHLIIQTERLNGRKWREQKPRLKHCARISKGHSLRLNII